MCRTHTMFDLYLFIHLETFCWQVFIFITSFLLKIYDLQIASFSLQLISISVLLYFLNVLLSLEYTSHSLFGFKLLSVCYQAQKVSCAPLDNLSNVYSVAVKEGNPIFVYRLLTNQDSWFFFLHKKLKIININFWQELIMQFHICMI